MKKILRKKRCKGKNRHACEKNSMKEKQKTVVEKGGKTQQKKTVKTHKKRKVGSGKNGRTSAKNSGKTMENAHKNAQKKRLYLFAFWVLLQTDLSSVSNIKTA